MGKIKINEIYKSINGEGIHAGLPTLFIRTSGCNHKCRYCDSKYTYDEGLYEDIHRIREEVMGYSGVDIACITGGEPLIQKDIVELVDMLVASGFLVNIETNGSILIPKELIENDSVVISMDIKCPSSGEHAKFEKRNLELLHPTEDQIKFIIQDEKDYNYMKDIICEYDLDYTKLVYVQPCWGVDAKWLVNKILDDELNVRFGLQLHKYIWDPDKKGV